MSSLGSGTVPPSPDAPAAVRTVSPLLVGRDAEMISVRDALAEPPSLVVITGDAGIGKTRLIREVISGPEVHGKRVLLGRAQELREPFPLGPVIGALRGAAPDLRRIKLTPLAGALHALLPEFSRALPEPLSPLDDPHAERHREFRALRELLAALGPSVLILEDLHWADRRTEDLLGFLLDDPPRAVTVVLTYREEDLSARSRLRPIVARAPGVVPTVRCALEPLSPDQVGELVAAILEGDVTGPFARYLHDRTGGIPFAVEEVVGLLQERRDLIRRNGRWVRRELDQLHVPTGYRETVLERLHRLPPDARRIAEAAAVLTEPARDEVLVSVSRLSPARAGAGLRDAVAGRFLERSPDDTVGFRHVLARQVVLESIPVPDRLVLHRNAAEALDRASPPPHAQLAHHWKESGDVERWVASAERAADVAVAQGDYASASRILGEVVRSGSVDFSVRAELAATYGRAAQYAMEHADAVDLLQGFVDAPETPADSRGEIRLALASVLHPIGDAAGWRRQAARAVEELPAASPRAGAAMAILAVPFVLDGDEEEHLGWLERSVAAAERAGDDAARVGIRMDRAAILLSLGKPGALEDLPAPADAVDPSSREELIRGFMNLNGAALELGMLAESDRFLQVARELSGDAGYGALATRSAGVVRDWLTGRWQGLEHRLKDARETEVEIAPDALIPDIVSSLLGLARGRVRDAEADLPGQAERATAAGSLPLAILALAGLQRLLLAAGQPDRAAAHADRAFEVVRRKRIWVWASDTMLPAALALGGAGRGNDLRQLLREASGGLQGRVAPFALAMLHAARGVLARGEAADAHFTESLRRLRGTGRTYEMAQVWEAWGRARPSRSGPGGRTVLEEALLAYDRLGATWDASRVRAVLRDRGITMPYRGGRRGFGPALSPREREVASFVAEGRTNREISEALFVSMKTVEKHLAAARRKLGASSREALGSAIAALEHR